MSLRSGLQEYYPDGLTLQIRTQADNIILQGIIDGRRKPQTLQGYIALIVEELERLWVGIDTYDAVTGETFKLRAMLICSQQDYVGLSDIAMQRGAGDPLDMYLAIESLLNAASEAFHELLLFHRQVHMNPLFSDFAWLT